MIKFWKQIKFRILGKNTSIILCEKTWKKGDFIIRAYGPGAYMREYLVTNIKEIFGGWEYKLKYLDV